MKHEAHVAAYWEHQLVSDGLAVLEVGTDTGNGITRVKSEGMARLHTTGIRNTERRIFDGVLLAVEYDAEGRHGTRDYGLTARGVATSRKGGSEPTDCMANSMADPELLGFYSATPKQAEMADRRRACHGIEFTRDSRGRVKGGASGKTRRSKAEAAAQRKADREAKAAARRAKIAAQQEARRARG